MVSLITEGSPVDEQGRPWRRRRYRPWVTTVAVFAVLGLLVWMYAMNKADENTVAMACNSPSVSSAPDPGAPAPTPLGKRVGASTLRDVEPAALSQTKVRVLNANGQRGEASHVASQLSELGFASGSDVVGNDTVYVDQNMQCTGQIRFGQQGRAAAASLQLAVPCAELIEDDRGDDTVDLALGTYFNDIAPNNDAEEVLRTLKEPPAGSTTPPLDLKLLEAARSARC